MNGISTKTKRSQRHCLLIFECQFLYKTEFRVSTYCLFIKGTQLFLELYHSLEQDSEGLILVSNESVAIIHDGARR